MVPGNGSYRTYYPDGHLPALHNERGQWDRYRRPASITTGGIDTTNQSPNYPSLRGKSGLIQSRFHARLCPDRMPRHRNNLLNLTFMCSQSGVR